MNNISEYIIEKLKLNKDSVSDDTIEYICFTGHIDELTYEIFTDKKELMQYIFDDFTNTRFVIKIKRLYTQNVIDAEKERLDKIHNRKDITVQQCNDEFYKYIASIGGIAFNDVSRLDMIDKIKKDKDNI